jgi:hypothetical protein
MRGGKRCEVERKLRLIKDLGKNRSKNLQYFALDTWFDRFCAGFGENCASTRGPSNAR